MSLGGGSYDLCSLSGRSASSIAMLALAMLAAVSSTLPIASAQAGPGSCIDLNGAPIEITQIVDIHTLRLADNSLVTLPGIEFPSSRVHQDIEQATENETRIISWLTSTSHNGDIMATKLGGKTDRYDRHPALIARDGVTLQEGLLAAGLAIMLPDERLPENCLERFLEAEKDARSLKKGFWRNGQIALLPAADYEQIFERVGRFAIIEGKVHSVGTRKNRTYLNFGTYWSQDMTVEIGAPHRENFGGTDALEQLTWQTVRVRGFVESKGGPMMAVRSPFAIEIVSAPRDDRQTVLDGAARKDRLVGTH